MNHFIDAVGRASFTTSATATATPTCWSSTTSSSSPATSSRQEEFFHTFNTIYQAQNQIILSSDPGPDYIPGVGGAAGEPVQLGPVARIDRPCYETRVAIVKKARLRNIELPEDVACFVAARIDSNTRELEAAIAKVAMLAHVSDRAIDLALAAEAAAAT